MKNAFLYVVVFVAGGAVLAVEILGTRILGPFYGVSLFLWSALISVTLIALSVGYAIGGRWADKAPRLARLYYFMSGAGVWVLLIAWLKKPVLLIAEPLGLRLAVLVAAFILFVPPLTLLGMVSPYAIRVRALSLKIVGRTAGDLYAISTVGSVVAALLTGFILIPNVGVSRLTLLIGVALLVTAAFGLALEMRTRPKRLATGAAAVLAGTVVFLSPADPANPERGLVAVEQSPYAEIRIVDMENKRHLVIDGGLHSIVEAQTWESRFHYVAVMGLPKFLFDEPGRLLLIGLGGGSLVKNYSSEGWSVDAVEIDPVVTEVAFNYFGLDSSEAKIFHMDGRQFLLRHPAAYDVILMDAFGSSSIPFHLVTREAFGLVASRMKPNAVLAINFVALGWNDLIVKSLSATLQQHFKEVFALPVRTARDTLTNMIMLASNEKLRLKRNYKEARYPDDMKFHMHHAWRNRFSPTAGKELVLTDDLNPVDLWAEAINLATRKELHGYFRTDVSW